MNEIPRYLYRSDLETNQVGEYRRQGEGDFDTKRPNDLIPCKRSKEKPVGHQAQAHCKQGSGHQGG